MSLRQHAAKGVAWSAAARVTMQVLQLGISVVLMRLLVPEVFGLLAMAMVFIGFARVFSEMGLGAALVHRRDMRPIHTSSVFWFNLGIGVVLAGGFLGLAPWIARFYETPPLVGVVQSLGVVFLVSALGVVPRALLQRTMQFDAIAKGEVAGVFLGGGSAIAVAFSGGGVWSLVVQYLVRSGVEVVALWKYTHWRPGWCYSGSALRDVLTFSAGYAGFNFINYWARTSDDLLIGRVMGSYQLGVYDRAYRLMLLPITEVARVISRVMFPALSAIQEDKVRVKRIYLRTMGVIALIVFPAMTGLFVVAESFVRVVFGAQWIDAAPLIQILCFVGITQAMCNPTGWIYTSQGRTDLMFWWGVGGSGTLIAAIVLGITFGTVEAVAIAYLIANVAITYPCIAIPGTLIDMQFVEVLRVVLGPFLCASLMAVGVWGVAMLMPADSPPGVQLISQVACGIALYASTVVVLRLEAYREARQLAVELWDKR